ncbi:hypothetical protein, partial [Phocaeicola dorei]
TGTVCRLTHNDGIKRLSLSYHSVEVSPPFMRILTRKKLENALLYTKLERSIKREYIADSKHIM